ncbi:low affinity immunoglobulin gamma Fc region receptor II-a-like [Oncorhynchus tshawytscha]|uniref:Ig-like domain-containing protein n=1 Tax=Oncorhynchus tshawytscha TaxID=74940 RepID=A0A8C8GSN5_ONCTS|nr:low affinity immunoglobulin gamma Fc region receptor II-a-like [Oncorhynchus tshawytscha]
MERTYLLTLLLTTLVYSSLGHRGGRSPSASLSISPDRSQFLEYMSFSLSCEVQGSSTGWRLKRYTATVKPSESGVDWGFNQSNYVIKTAKTSDSGVYWCESGSGEHSNAVNITVHGGAVILESPALPVTEDDSVTLRCKYQATPAELTADFYKDGSLIGTETTGEMTIPAVSKSDEGLYKCNNSEGESPASWMTVKGWSSASLSISPDRSQFLEYKSVSLSCEVQASAAGWRLKRYTVTGVDWGFNHGSNYVIKTAKTSDSGVYWCESRSGQCSNAVNFTVHGGAVILESPALPVTEGDSVTLRCRHEDKKTKDTSSNLTADFYKDGSLIRTEMTGEMTIPAVSKSNEGLYKCNNSEGESPESWMTVTGPGPVWSISLPRLLCSLLVVSPYLLVTIVLLVKFHRRRAQGETREPRKTHQDQPGQHVEE